MQSKILIFFLAAACILTHAQLAIDDSWTGIWRAHVDGLPTDTLTLAADTGQLGGTIVLDMIGGDDDQPRVVASEPHILMALRVDSNRLSFQVKMKRPAGSTVIASFEVTRTAPDKVALHCVSCGPDAPVVTLVRGN